MRPEWIDGQVKATCPDCGAVTTFEERSPHREYGYISIELNHEFDGGTYRMLLYRLLRCAGCGRAGVAKVHVANDPAAGDMEWFFPMAISRGILPATPAEIITEFREAEQCAGAGAWRAGSAMLRSALEKILKLNGYTAGNLKSKIDDAGTDGVLTEARRRRAHDEIRVLGNDVLHDAWREVDASEFELAQHYTQRVIEDFYDDRPTVEQALRGKGRVP